MASQNRRTGMYFKRGTRDRINLFRARFTLVADRSMTQDDALTILMNFYNVHGDDSQALQYLPSR